jgi:hypothetical protein
MLYDFFDRLLFKIYRLKTKLNQGIEFERSVATNVPPGRLAGTQKTT